MTKISTNKYKDLEHVYRLMRKYKVNYTKTKEFEITINESTHLQGVKEELPPVVGFTIE